VVKLIVTDMKTTTVAILKVVPALDKLLVWPFTGTLQATVPCG
jgi:hypothetical protein